MSSYLSVVQEGVPYFDQDRLADRVLTWQKRWRKLGNFCTLSQELAEMDPNKLLLVESEVCDTAYSCLKPYLSPSAVVLDAGIGPANIAVRIAPEVGSFIGVDFCPEIIQTARENLRAAGIPEDGKRCSLQVAHLGQLSWGRSNPIPQKSVDILLLSRVLIHITNETEFRFVIEEVCRVLAPQGIVLICGPEAGFYNPQYPGDVFAKNEDTVIRSGKVYANALWQHGMIEVGTHQLLHVFSEVYTYRCFQKQREHTEIHRR